MRRKVKKFSTCLLAFALMLALMGNSQLSVLAETVDAPAPIESVSDTSVFTEQSVAESSEADVQENTSDILSNLNTVSEESYDEPEEEIVPSEAGAAQTETGLENGGTGNVSSDSTGADGGELNNVGTDSTASDNDGADNDSAVDEGGSETDGITETETEVNTETETEADSETEYSGLIDNEDQSIEDISETNPVDALFERLMAYETYDELTTAMESLTDEEYALMAQFSDEQNAALQEKVNELSEYEVETLEDRSYTIQAGGSQTVSVKNISQNNSNTSYSCNPNAEITVTFNTSGNNRGYTINVGSSVSAGTYTLTVKYKKESASRITNDTVTIIVTEPEPDDTPEGKVKVYVYVSSKDSNGNSWQDNEEFQDLIGLYVCDNNGYYPAGTIYLDESYFSGKTNADTEGYGLINSATDWSNLISTLSGMDNNTMTGTLGAKWSSNNKSLDFSNNNGNSVGKYLEQAEEIYNQGWGSMHTSLHRWHHTFDVNSDTDSHLGHYGDITTKYHLDLCFNINTIKFICGNNGITQTKNPNAYDGYQVDSRAYITGSLIQDPRNLNIPAGYQFMGYYTDPDFTTPWNGIGTPLNSDQTVYIKITEKENIVLYYKVAQGVGTVSPEDEAFNPETGSPTGSTATAGTNYVFEGWYADEACTQKLSSDAKYEPTKPADGWVSGTTYYAKFVPANFKLTIQKTVSGNMYDANKEFTFTVEYDGKEAETFKLKKDGTYTIEGIPVGVTVTVSEAPDGYTYSCVSITEGVTKEDTTNGISFTMPAQDVTVVINNEKNVTVDTGILLDTLPYILILAVVAVGAVLLIKKRRNRDDD